MAVHMVKALDEWADKRKLSTVKLFSDLKAAFYSVLRPLLVDLDLSDEALAELLARLQIEPEAMQRLAQRLQQANTLDQADVDRASRPRPWRGYSTRSHANSDCDSPSQSNGKAE